MFFIRYILTFVYTVFMYPPTNCAQLVVNVKNKGGDVLQQTIEANTTQDTVLLHFRKYDGTLVAQFIDFKNEIQIFKTTVLGEIEQGQHGHQVMCYVLRFVRNEFISSDAMSKLRQKNPGAIRHPEEDKGQEKFEMDLLIDLSQSHIISPYVSAMCHDARDTTYAKDNDLNILAKTLKKDYTMLLGATKRTALYKLQACHQQQDTWRPCICKYEICMGWFPCGLKYCKGKDSTGKVVSYRCGIKTCRKCRLFQYYARQKLQCLWDEVDLYGEGGAYNQTNNPLPYMGKQYNHIRKDYFRK